ncbi:MAG: SDR family oxidoreductase [Gammaproteobacteria bacterium]|nr:SDR family oxidoreductase [Gammaproteobacteria bacterium]
MSVYLVTGASGVVGSAIVPVLLQRPDAKVYILLRAKKGQSLDSRFEELKKFWCEHYSALSSEMLSTRVSPMNGEITESLLGLNTADQGVLTQSCTNIIHCAASVRMNLPLDEARQTALFPVQSVIALSKSCRALRKTEFISTVGVGGRREGALPELWITEPREFHNTYEASKAEAEDLLRNEIAGGFSATVHRPSMVVGDSNTGAVIHFQIFYFICDFLSGRRTFGVYPDIARGTLDIVPNDYVARAVVAASMDTATIGKIFHLCSGPQDALRLTELREIVRAKFRAAKRMGWLPTLDLSAANFTRLVRALARLLPERERRAIGTLPVYLDYLSGVQQFSNEITSKQLNSYGILAVNNRQVLDRVLDFYLSAE